MRFILNIIWLVLCGFWMAVGYVVAGIICCVLIVTIPWGLALFRIANYALWPFGRTIVDKPTAGACRSSATSSGSWSPACGWPSATRSPASCSA